MKRGTTESTEEHGGFQIGGSSGHGASSKLPGEGPLDEGVEEGILVRGGVMLALNHKVKSLQITNEHTLHRQVQQPGEHQERNLLDDRQRVGNPARPEFFPKSINPAAQRSCNHQLSLGAWGFATEGTESTEKREHLFSERRFDSPLEVWQLRARHTPPHSSHPL
jgi:hypothetical protein